MSKNKLNNIVKIIRTVAKELDKHPNVITQSELFKNSKEEITEWDIRSLGGLKAIQNSHFPVTDKQLDEISKNKEITAYINKLEKELGNKQKLEEEVRASILKAIKPIKVTPYKIKAKAVKDRRHVVAMLNDLHIGLIVKPEEVDNLNAFDFKIASRRVALFIDEVCKYKRSKRDEVETLHFILNGDLIAGVIHGLLGKDLELLGEQFAGALHIFTNAVARLSENYANVNVYFSTGNHGDRPHRREGGRVLSQVYDSIEGDIFYALSVAHRNTKNVKFTAGKSLSQDFMLPAGRAAFTHGHLMFSKALGNPGTTVNTKSLGTAISDLNSSERVMGRPEYKLLLFGHTHCHFHITTKDGVQIYNAPSLSGIDSFAFSIGIRHNLTAQVVFESTQDYIMGDIRLIHVQKADKNVEYDEIIKPYKKTIIYEAD